MNKRKKAIKVVIAILIAAVAFGYGGYTTMRPGVYVGDDFFYEKSSSRYEQDASNYIEQTSDHEFTVVSHDKKQEVSYEIEKEQITFQETWIQIRKNCMIMECQYSRTETWNFPKMV